jgi:hypothetical protein
MRPIADEQPSTATDSRRFQGGDFLLERLQIDHNPISDNADFSRMENARGNQVKNVFPAVDQDGVSRIVASLVPGNYVEMFREKVHELPFSLVTPLSSNYDQVRHSRKSAFSVPSAGWGLFSIA